MYSHAGDGPHTSGPVLEAELGDIQPLDGAGVPDAATGLAGDQRRLLLERHLRDELLRARERVRPSVSARRIRWSSNACVSRDR